LSDGSRGDSINSVLIVLFIGSGCSALIYEIVWFQLLELIVGSSAISMAILLTTFMGGMCLGSLFASRIIPRRHHPLLVYAVLEVAIGIMGILILSGSPFAGGLMFRGLIAGLCLLPPTFLMGATLPVVGRWVEATPKGVSLLGFFYGGNIAGGVFGSLLAGFYLLRVYDLATATYVAVAINIAVAAVAVILSKSLRANDGEKAQAKNIAIRPAGRAATVYVAIGISGMCALGAEVLWTRLLSLLLGPTVYAFSIILAVFLLGLGIGSSMASAISRWIAHPRRALGLCQILLTLAIAWAAYMLTQSIPYWPIYPPLSRNMWFSFQLDVVRCLWAIFPAAFFWGASFPLALASVASDESDAGRLVGRVYAANTAGAIVGALAFSLVFIKWIGTQHGQQVLIVLSALAGALMLRTAISAGGAAVLGVALALTVGPVPAPLIAYGRLTALRLGLVDSRSKTPVAPEILYAGEGLNTSIAISRLDNNVRNFHVSGKIEASSAPKDMQLQRMLGNIPALAHSNPRSVLVVGFGAGVTAGTFVLYPGVERIVICEIEPLIPQVVARYFSAENNDVLHDPRVQVVYDDARHYILSTNEKFDIITSDPIHPWVKGSAALYTREYFELVRNHLNPGGVVSQWVPLYESGRRTVQSEMATFFDVFPNATLWSTNASETAQDLVLLASDGASRLNLDDLNVRLYRPDHVRVARSLQEVGFRSTIELFATYLGRASDLGRWASGAEINRDRNLRLQYLAGTELNVVNDPVVYEDLLAYRQFPDDLFAGSDALKGELRYAMSRKKTAPK
jgi:spermidine synthase